MRTVTASDFAILIGSLSLIEFTGYIFIIIVLALFLIHKIDISKFLK